MPLEKHLTFICPDKSLRKGHNTKKVLAAILKQFGFEETRNYNTPSGQEGDCHFKYQIIDFPGYITIDHFFGTRLYEKKKGIFIPAQQNCFDIYAGDNSQETFERICEGITTFYEKAGFKTAHLRLEGKLE